MNISLLEAVEIFGDDAKTVLTEKFQDTSRLEQVYRELLDAKVDATKRLFNHDEFTRWFSTRVLTYKTANRLSQIQKERRNIETALLLLTSNGSKSWEGKIQRAKQMPIESLYSGNLKKTAKDRYVGLCPFHKEVHPSFTIYGKDNTYHCFGCTVHGDSIDFLIKQSGLDFPDAVRRLAP